MAMQSVYFKGHERTVNNQIGQSSPVQAVPWWGGFSSQSVYGETLGTLKSTEHSAGGDHGTATKQVERSVEQGQDKGIATQFTIFRGDCKNSLEGKRHQPAFSVESAPPEYCTRFDLGFGQPVICAKLPYADQCYGVFSSYGSQVSGRVMLPLNLANDDGPIYVNAKQYHGIIRRRQSRAKAEMENKAARLRKPYMHESRHRHAMRRPRGCGGRFLNKKALTNVKSGGTKATKVGDGLFCQTSGSHSSEVLQSDSGTINSLKEANGSRPNHPGSEVTSMYYRGDMDPFHGHDITMPYKWVAADNCCDLKV